MTLVIETPYILVQRLGILKKRRREVSYIEKISQKGRKIKKGIKATRPSITLISKYYKTYFGFKLIDLCLLSRTTEKVFLRFFGEETSRVCEFNSRKKHVIVHV